MPETVTEYAVHLQWDGIIERPTREAAENSVYAITSKGWEATQSVMHLHAHLVPRAEGDGLALPWCSGKHNRKAAHSA